MRKSIFTSLFLMLLITNGKAQDDFSLFFSQTYSKFKYIDSEGNSSENLKSDIRYSYGINYSKIVANGIFIRPEIGYKNLGATSMNNNQKLSWDLHYADLNLGGGYIHNKFNLQPYGGCSFYVAYLYKAEQTIGINTFDLLDAKELENIDFGINVFAGLRYVFTDAAAILIEIQNSTGLQQLEPNNGAEQNQKLYNRAFSGRIGLLFLISGQNGKSKFKKGRW